MCSLLDNQHNIIIEIELLIKMFGCVSMDRYARFDVTISFCLFRSANADHKINLRIAYLDSIRQKTVKQ